MRLLLMLIVAFGLAAGPAWSWEICAGPQQVEDCSCCPAPGEACCVSETEAPIKEAPERMIPGSVQLKSLLAPVCVFVGLQPQHVGFKPSHLRDCTKIPAAQPLLDLNCIRLI